MILELHATPEEVMRAVDKLQEFAQARQIPEKAIFGLALALEECGSNIVNHALRQDARQKFKVTVEHKGDALIIELRDRGPAFDPTAADERGPQAEDDGPPGGWGIQLVRRYMDEVHYERAAEENVLRLTKRISSANGDSQLSSTRTKQPETKNAKTDMPLEIQIQRSIDAQNAGVVTVKLTGSLDTSTAPDLERQLAPILGSQAKELVFDLAQLKFISSAGLRVFATARKQLRERGGQASFVHLQPQIQEVFEIVKALPGVAVFKDMAELDAYLAARQKTHEGNS